ncbi:unnamed protein product, partial [Linum tenue]
GNLSACFAISHSRPCILTLHFFFLLFVWWFRWALAMAVSLEGICLCVFGFWKWKST